MIHDLIREYKQTVNITLSSKHVGKLIPATLRQSPIGLGVTMFVQLGTQINWHHLTFADRDF